MIEFLEIIMIKKMHQKYERDLEKQLTDALTCGQGFAEQTDFPPRIEHVPYNKIYNDKCMS